MIKNILNFQGVEQLSRKQKSTITGGVEKCCIRVPSNGIMQQEISDDTANDGSWCNSNPSCNGEGEGGYYSKCGCVRKNGGW